MHAIVELVSELRRHRDVDWAWQHFIPTVTNFVRAGSFRSVLEVGGGRAPSLSMDDVETLGVRYTVNDISERELALAPTWVSRALFDIQTEDTESIVRFEGDFDFLFSRMVMEHVASSERAYKNIFRLLAPGGVALSFHPVLHALPFVLNKYAPEAVSKRLLGVFFSSRNQSEIPKFRAFYDGCSVKHKVREDLRSLGFSNVWQIPFFGHNYYSRVPVLRSLHSKVTEVVRERGLVQLATFSYTIVQK